MSTRSGVHYHPSQSDPELTMDNDIRTMLRSMTEKLDDLCNRVQTLEGTHSVPTDPESPRSRPHDPTLDPDIEATPRHEPRRPHQRDHGYHPRRPQYPGPEYYPREPHPYDHDYAPRRPNPEAVNPDDQVIKNVRIDAPTFDGSLDPKVYNDWEGDMEQYFNWYEMSEGRKFKFAKTRLVRQARLYWNNVELLIGRRGDQPIDTWRAMKVRLREKYVPMSYK